MESEIPELNKPPLGWSDTLGVTLMSFIETYTQIKKIKKSLFNYRDELFLFSHFLISNEK